MQINHRKPWICCWVLLLISIILFCDLMNHYRYHFPGENYTIPQSLLPAVLLLLGIGYGLKISAGVTSHAARVLQEVSMGLLLVSLMLSAGSAIALTPFAPIDAYIIRSDQGLHLDISLGMHWLQTHTMLKACLIWIYEQLDCLMFVSILALIISRRFALLYEYYTWLLISAVFGFFIYYFFPTTAPASVLHSPYFTEAQHATGLKFYQLHHYIKPTTDEGGLIAFPSFHVIWAWFTAYAMRCWPIVFSVLCLYTLGTILSCVLLGWHYATDIIGSVVVIGLTHAIDGYFLHDKYAQFRHQH